MPETFPAPHLVYDSAKTLESMSIAELEQLNAQFMKVKADVRRWQQRLNAVMSQKIEREGVIRKLNELTPDQRSHLAQVIRAEGIPSKEAVNG